MRQYFGLEPSHLAGGGRRAFRGPPANHMPHGGINREPFGVIGVFVACQPAEDGLPHQRDHRVLRVLSRAPIVQQLIPQVGQTQRRVQLPIGQQPGIRRDLCAVKFQLQAAIEHHPQSRFFACTRWILHFLLVRHR